MFGVAWRRDNQRDIGPFAACNVAAIVKAYTLRRFVMVQMQKLVEELTNSTVATRKGRSAPQQANPFAPEGASPAEIPGKSRRPSRCSSRGT